MVSSSVAVRIGLVEVASTAVDGIYHVAFAICDDSRILGSNVVQYLCQSCHGGHGGFSFL